MAFDADVIAVGQRQLELTVGVPVERCRRVILARGGREAVEHRGDEGAQARLAGLVGAVHDDEIALGQARQLELGERAVGADADAIDPHVAASLRSASASVSSSSASSSAR